MIFALEKDREGDFSMLKQMSLEHNFELQKINGVSIGRPSRQQL
jgi:hypothetical protein